MPYALLTEAGTYLREITERGNILWDDTHFCPAAALTPEERNLFRVVDLTSTPMPEFDPLTHVCQRDGGEFVEGRWQYKWRIDVATAEQKAAAQTALIARYTAALDTHIDNVAKADRWDSRITCVARASYSNPWQAKAVAFGTWMDACYALAYQILAEVETGARPMPTIAEFLAAMPTMEWPK